MRPPAEPTVSTGCLRRRHQAIASTLLRKLSQASITRSKPPPSRDSRLAAVRNAGTARASTAGLMARQRSAITSALLRPYCSAMAGNWRLVLDTHRSSASISSSAPTAERASASATHEPTPPRPTTATRRAASHSTAPRPYSRSIPAKRSDRLSIAVILASRACHRGRRCAYDGDRPTRPEPALMASQEPRRPSAAARYLFVLVTGL